MPICRNVRPGNTGNPAAWNHSQRFPGGCPLDRGARAGMRLPLPMGLALAPTDQACFSLDPPTALPGDTHTHTFLRTSKYNAPVVYYLALNKGACITCDVNTNRKGSGCKQLVVMRRHAMHFVCLLGGFPRSV